MRTRGEPFVGRFVGSAFPTIPSVPPSFPFGRVGVRQKRNAGVAELVDALVLGTSGLPNTVKALAPIHDILWCLVREPAQMRPLHWKG